MSLMTTPIHLPDRALVLIGGADAESFLQNLITCDVASLEPNRLALGALLAPQGKILFEFLIGRQTDDAEGFIADVRLDQVDEFVKRLTFYKLRAAVTVAQVEQAVGALLDAAATHGLPDPRHSSLGRRVWGDITTYSAADDSYDLARLAAGVPELGKDFAPQTTFPHEVLMDQYAKGGVDFTKGCYVGQEVVSRMQHRGTARSRFVLVSGAEELPAAGTDILAGDRTIGQMGSHIGTQGLALVRLDRVGRTLADGGAITSDGKPITLALPEFVSFDWPVSGDGTAAN